MLMTLLVFMLDGACSGRDARGYVRDPSRGVTGAVGRFCRRFVGPWHQAGTGARIASLLPTLRSAAVAGKLAQAGDQPNLSSAGQTNRGFIRRRAALFTSMVSGNRDVGFR